MAEINPLWDEYILWLATPDHERGPVATEDEWATANGYSDSRTMRRWKNKPEFLERQRALTQSMAAKSGASVTFDSEDTTFDSEERDYRLVKSKLVESAKQGNLKAQELFMKLYGQSWLDEEQAARSSDYSNMELPALIAQTIVAVGAELVADALREQGYTVVGGKP